MADLSIRKDFIEGVQEVFTTLFNEGVTDGVEYFALDLDSTKQNVYNESKYGKVYHDPKMLVCKAEIAPTQGVQTVESVKNKATFTVTLKSLQDRNLGVTEEDLSTMQRGIMKFNGLYYYIDLIRPKAYVEDVFLLYAFECTQILDRVEFFIESYSDGDALLSSDSKVLIRG